MSAFLTFPHYCLLQVYIGETGCRLPDHFKEDYLHVLHSKGDLPVEVTRMIDILVAEADLSQRDL